MSNISEKPMQPKTMANLQRCAQDAIELLGVADKAADSKAVVEAIDAFVYRSWTVCAGLCHEAEIAFSVQRKAPQRS